MKLYVKCTIIVLLFGICHGVRCQNVDFQINVVDNVLHYIVVNKTGNDICLLQNSEANIEEGSHCVIACNNNSEILPVMDKRLVLIKSEERYIYDICLTDYKRLQPVEIYCKAVVVGKDKNGKGYTKKISKHVSF